mgnify:CR=1 FL=1
MNVSTNPATRFLPGILLVFFMALAVPVLTSAQTTAPESTTIEPISDLNKKTLENKIQQVESDTNLAQETMDRLVNLYRKTISNLESETARLKAAEDFRLARQNAPAMTRSLEQRTVEAKKTSPEESIEVSPETSIDILEQSLLKEKADLAAVSANLQKAREAIKYQSNRPQVIRDELVEARKQASGLADKLKPTSSEDHSDPLVQASSWVRESSARALTAQIRMLDEELLSQPARLDLLEAELEKAEHSVRFVTARTEILEKLLNEKRLEQALLAEDKAATAQALAAGSHPLVVQIAARNAELSSLISTLTGKLEALEQERSSINAEIVRINNDFTSAKKKLDVAGLSQILGQVLQEQRRSLPDTRSYRAKADKIEKQIAEISLAQIQHKDELADLRDVDEYVDKYVATARDEVGTQTRSKLFDLANDRKLFLDQASNTEEAYLRALSDLDFAQRALNDTAQEFDTYLTERLLWIRSTNPVSLATLTILPGQIRQLLAVQNWHDILATLYRQATSKPWIVLTLLAFGLLLWKERALRKQLLATGSHVGNVINDRIAYTAWGLVLTPVLALSWPLLLAGIGWQLADAGYSSSFTKNVGSALLLTAQGLFMLRAYRVLCMKGGVAERHFRWPAASLALLRRDIDIFIYTFLPAGFIALVVINSNMPGHDEGLGRLAFVFASLALAGFLYRVLNPTRGAMREISVRQKKPAKIGMQYLRLIIAIIIPIASAILALLGYLYSAGTLLENLIQTLWLILELVILHQFVERWLLIARRRLALQQARAEREARLAARNEVAAPTEDVPEFEEPKIDIDALSDDIRKLLNTSLVILATVVLWASWSDILPAFRIFEDITLWQHKVDVEGVIEYRPITLANLGLAIISLVVLVLLVKRLPAFIEILLRQSATISPGSIYAIKSLASYTVIAIGVVVVFSTLGGSWSEIQWVFAALGVGIGFGLQEIVANFISGLIILFERPIRVGDMVTVGEVNGIVTKIRIRATTIRDFDRKELLVPNKEFITNRLLNWSLSDTVTRVMIPVGVAYGSDVALAARLMEEAANESEHALSEPPTSVIFDSFGDNSLVLILRYFIDNPDFRIISKSKVNEAINDKFNAAGITISFPQRDIHLDTERPLDIRIHRGDD